MTVRIGLTGPIGCGKSTVARWLAERREVVIIDADQVAREVVEPGEPALEAVVARFGSELRRSDGTLDRAALGRIVFADPDDLRDLEAIIHPAVRPRILASVAAAEAEGADVVVIEAIKLIEGGLAEICDEVWLIACEPEVQLQRLAGRGSPAEDAVERVAAQGGLVDRLLPAATLVVDTSAGPAVTRAIVVAALDALVEASRDDRPA